MRIGPLAATLATLTITVSLASGRTWHVNLDGTGDAPTIKAACDSAVVGDTVLVDCGTYSERDIHVRGAALRSATGAANCVTIEQVGTIILVGRGAFVSRLEGLTLRGATIAAVACSGSAVVERCAFEDNRGGAVEVPRNAQQPETLTLRECEFRGNTAHRYGNEVATIEASPTQGLSIDNTLFEFNGTPPAYGFSDITMSAGRATIANSRFISNDGRFFVDGDVLCSELGENGSLSLTVDRLIDCVVANNHSLGRAVVTADVVRGCTFAANTLGRFLTLLMCSTSVTNSIFAYNIASAAVSCASPATSVSCCDFFANTFGDAPGCNAMHNFFAAPRFCLRFPGDFTLDSTSPCAPGHTPCGLIGALPVACGTVSLETRSWGRIKSLYR